MISIRQPLFFTEIGQKENQEDSLFPLDPSPASRVFVLCDGMGGHDNGEVASSTVSQTLGDYLSAAMKDRGVVDINTFKEGLAEAYSALDRIDTNSLKKPGTTMACLCLNENSYLVAHIGDSRIYHIRPSLYNPGMGKGGIIYKSSDHSLVNDLLKAGEITKEQARTFPHKNVITRAMQPHLEQPYKADAYIFSDVLPGDYFFICCDGVLERLTNRELCRIIADPNLDDEGKLNAIQSICDGKTRDNYTCWLIPVDNVEINKHAAYMPGNSNASAEQTVPMAAAMQAAQSSMQAEESAMLTPPENSAAGPASEPLPEPRRESAFIHTMRWLTDAAVLLMLIFAIWMMADTWRKERPDQVPVTDSVTEKQDTTAIDSTLNAEEKIVEEALQDSTSTQESTNPQAESLYNNPKYTPKKGNVSGGKSPTPSVTPTEQPTGNEATAPTEGGGETAPQPEKTQSAAQEGTANSVKENIKEVNEKNEQKPK